MCIRDSGEPVFIKEMAEGMEMDGPKELIISNCMAILEEIELVKQQEVDGNAAVSLTPEPQERRDLKESQRYATGEKIRSEWAKFSDFMVKRKAEEIHRMLVETIS